MPLRRRLLPSFTFPTSSRRDPFSFPGYYRSTRLEHYGPYYRSSEPVRDLMQTIDLRGRDGPVSICALSDILEEDESEFELADMGFQSEAKLEQADDLSGCDGTEYTHKPKQQEKTFAWLWRLFSSVLRKCRG